VQARLDTSNQNAVIPTVPVAQKVAKYHFPHSGVLSTQGITVVYSTSVLHEYVELNRTRLRGEVSERKDVSAQLLVPSHKCLLGGSSARPPW
jgi:hypothetical protein